MNNAEKSSVAEITSAVAHLKPPKLANSADIGSALACIGAKHYALTMSGADISRATKDFRMSAKVRSGTFWPTSIFGEKWVGHGMCATRSLEFGDPQTEPRITRRLAHFLSPNNTPRRSIKRALTFLSALGKTTDFPLSLRENEVEDLVVHSERQTESQGIVGRADIWIEWQNKSDHKKFVVVIECKLDASEQPNQTKRYEIVAESISDERPLLYFVSKDGRAAEAGTSWRQAIWAALLRNWEIELSNQRPRDLDLDFSCFRRDMWWICTGG